MHTQSRLCTQVEKEETYDRDRRRKVQVSRCQFQLSNHLRSSGNIQQSTNCRGASSMFRNLLPFGHRALILTESSARAGGGVTIDSQLFIWLQRHMGNHGNSTGRSIGLGLPRFCRAVRTSNPPQRKDLAACRTFQRTKTQNKEMKREGVEARGSHDLQRKGRSRTFRLPNGPLHARNSISELV